MRKDFESEDLVSHPGFPPLLCDFMLVMGLHFLTVKRNYWM